MASSLDSELDFPDLSSMLEQSLTTEICPYDGDSSNDRPAYVDSSVEGSICNPLNALKHGSSAVKEIREQNNLNPAVTVNEEHEFYQDYVKDKAASLTSFKCTVCSGKIWKSNACTHPVLDVLVCKNCRGVYGNGQFEQSEGTDDYCRWCAEGGDQICCDHCSNVFCTDCLRRNLGAAALKEIKHSGQWTCLACNPKPIWNLRAECRWLINDSQDYNGEENSHDDDDVPAESLPEILKAAKSIGTRYLQDIERITEKSQPSGTTDRILLTELDAAVEETLSALRTFKETLSTKVESVAKQDAGESEEPRLILKFKNFREINERDGFYAEIRHSPHGTAGRNPQDRKAATETQSASDKQPKEDHTAAGIAKGSPVKEQSEDSMGDFFDMAKAAMERSENSPQSPVLPETDDAPAAKETAVDADEPDVDAKEKARNKLLATSDSDLSDILSSPRTKKTKRRDNSNRTSKNSAKSPDGNTKTTKEAKSKKQTEDSDSEAALDKKIKRLEDLNLSKSKQPASEAGSMASSRPKRATNSKKKPSALLSDGSGDDSDTEEETKTLDLDDGSPKKAEAVDEKEKARQELLAVSSDSSAEEQAEGKTKSGSKSKKPVKNEKVAEDSDDDFVDTKEKKIDPETLDLLNAPLTEGGTGDNDDEDSEKDKKKRDTEEKKKRAKRRIKSDSESAAGSDSDFESDNKGNKSESGESSDGDQPKRKKRRRIKAATSSGSGSDSDVQILNDSQKSAGKGRKNIKKIIKDKHLHSQTKEAVREEQERIRRIQDRQNFYNESFKDDYMVNARIEKLVLDFDPDTKKELVSVDKRLVEKLKPHQAKGVKFMWDACFESLERLKEHPGSGCILAHCMGLGKTLQVVTLVHTVLAHPDCNVKKVLVVCPLSTVLNWVNEFKTWLVDDMEPDVYELANVKQNDMRMYHVRMWSQNGGILVMGYEMYRNITNEKNKRVKAKYREIFQRALVDPGPDMVVCDEGHLLKNEAAALSKAINRIATRRRIVLTGTPLQNSLTEYHCMIQFVKPNLLGTRKEFTNRFANPIKNGQCADSTEHDVRIMKRRAHVLHKKLEGCVQRFDYSVLTPFLPPKHEYVISVKMSEMQINMYRHYLEKCARGGPNASMPAGRGKGSGLFADFQELGKIWTHPRALQLAQIRREQRATGDSEDSMNDFIDDGSGSEGGDEVVCLDNTDDESNEEAEEENTGIAWKSRTRAGRGSQPAPEEDLSTVVTSNCWWSQFVTEDDMVKIEHSGKLLLLMEILRKCELIGDKVLVFSQSLVTLDLIEEFLRLEEERRHEAGFIQDAEDTALGTWRLNVDYFRFDGSTSAELRKNWCNSFNSPKNSRARLFLISTRAGGLGINMVAANRVIIFDASWNPSHDVQSIFRVYRFGQKKPCYIYRFLAQGTMEEKIYDRQVTKLSLSCRVVDEQQIERHFNASDLAELYSFDPDSHMRRPTPMVPRDRLLGELMMHQKQWIVTFHEHDSLLQNKADEELNEDERKAAWEDYENENRGILTTPMFDNNPAAAGLLEAQLQMLAGRTVGGVPLAALVNNIRSAYPNVSGPELLQRLQMVVEQIQNMNVPQYAAMMAATGLGMSQQPLDAQRLMLQRQQALEQQQKNQFSGAAMQQLLQAASMGAGVAGPSGIMAPVQARRGRPPIGPHQRTDMYYPTVRPNILSSAPRVAPSAKNPPGSKP